MATLPPLRLRAALLLTTAAISLIIPVHACTSLLLKTSDGGYVYGRTMEFGFELESAGVVIPRGLAYTATGPDGKPGLKWTSRYGVAGMNVFGLPYVADGINEKGLAGGILYFPEYASYADPAKADPQKTVAPWEFLTWALTNFQTVAEVKEAIAGLSIIGVPTPGLGIVAPFHYTLHDTTGASIVIEPLDGMLKVTDNPFGVMTNSPPFEWHLTNLKNYVKLSPYNAPPMEVGDQKVPSLGQGSGWLGVPGDPTPPSRFIRALGFSMTAAPLPTGDECVRLVEHIMNNFDIPIGSIRSRNPKEDPDYTQWTSIADMTRLRYYVKTYTDQTLRCLDLKAFDLDAKTILTAPLKPDLAPPALVPSAN